MRHSNDYTEYAHALRPDGSLVEPKDGYLAVDAGDVIIVYRSAREIKMGRGVGEHVVTADDVTRGYIAAGTAGTLRYGALVNPVFIRRINRVRAGDAGSPAVSLVPGATAPQ